MLVLVVASGSACATQGLRSSAASVSCRSGTLQDARDRTAAPVPVHWVNVAGGDDQVLLDRWCAAVGTPILAHGADARMRADSLLIVSWNVFVGGGDVRAFVRDLQAGGITTAAPVEHFVLLLQETFRAGHVPQVSRRDTRFGDRVAPRSGAGRTDVIEIARELGLHLLYVPSMRNGRPGLDPAEDKGNAILSTLPLTEPTFIELPLERQRRVAVLATVSGARADGSLWSLQVSSVHLDNRSRPERLLRWFGAFRVDQARALLDALQNEWPLVLGGDLNTWSLRRIERTPALLREHLPDAPEDLSPTMRLLGFLPRRLDHLLARLPSGTARQPYVIAKRYGSDHMPVAMWVLP